MTRRTQENIVAGFLVCLFVAYIAITLGFGPNARLVPLPIATLGLLLTIAQLVRQNLGVGELKLDLFASLTGQVTPVDESDAADRPDPTDQRNRELRAAAFVTGFVGMILLLGPIPAVFLFLTGFLILTRHYPVPKTLLVASGFTIALYVLFVLGLQLQLYHGVLAPLIEP